MRQGRAQFANSDDGRRRRAGESIVCEGPTKLQILQFTAAGALPTLRMQQSTASGGLEACAGDISICHTASSSRVGYHSSGPSKLQMPSYSIRGLSEVVL